MYALLLAVDFGKTGRDVALLPMPCWGSVWHERSRCVYHLVRLSCVACRATAHWHYIVFVMLLFIVMNDRVRRDNTQSLQTTVLYYGQWLPFSTKDYVIDTTSRSAVNYTKHTY